MSSATPTAGPSKAIVFVRRTASTLGLWALVTAIFLSHQGWAFLGLITLLALAAGAATGAVNGFFVTVMKVPPLVTTMLPLTSV